MGEGQLQFQHHLLPNDERLRHWGDHLGELEQELMGQVGYLLLSYCS
jgi:hypothetical protein